MPKAIAILSPFHNLSTGDLVDQLGGLKAAIADLEKRQKALRDELLSRAVEHVEGAQFAPRSRTPSGGRWTRKP